MGRHGTRSSVVGVAAGALLLAACSSGAAAGPASAPGGQSTASAAQPAAALTGAAADAAAFAALDQTAQEQQLATASASAERALIAGSDLEKALGGPAATDAAYAAVTATLVKQAKAYQATPDFGRFGAGPVAADQGGFGGMTFAGWMIGGLGMQAAVGGTNDAKQGDAPKSFTKKDSFDGGTSELTMSGSVGSASLDWNLTSTQKGMAGSVHIKGTINPCPDVNGAFSANVTLDTAGASDSGSGSVASTVDIALSGTVDDSAAITGYDTTTHSQAKSGSRGQVADVTTTTSYGANGVTAATRGDNAASGGSVTEGQQWGTLGMITETLVTKGILEATKSGIESGRCVTLNAPTTPSKTSGLKPSTSVSIAAQPRSKVDGTPTGGTITGTLTGAASLDPSSTPVKADATYAYVAPDKEDERATVALESRSKRGVGKAQIPFDTVVTRGYAIGQKVGPILYNAVNCGSAAGPWTITYELVDLPGMKGGGVIKLTFPKEPAPHDEAEIITTVGTDKGEYKAVGLPGGVRFGGPASATLQRYGAHLKIEITTSGMATGYAPGKQKTMTENAGTVLLVAQAASATECPTK